MEIIVVLVYLLCFFLLRGVWKLSAEMRPGRKINRKKETNTYREKDNAEKS